MPQWFIESIDITGGFLSGLTLNLPRGLTCIIGPRGSGKSTLAEALRFGLTGMVGTSKPRAELIQANLGSSTHITIQTVPCEEGTGYKIRRNYKQPVSLVTSDGKPVPGVDLDRGTFLPIDVYSSVEIESIADESVGERRRSLLDELRADELRDINLALGDRRRELEANAAKIEAAERLAADLIEQIEELGDARAKLGSLPPPPEGHDSDGLTRSARQQKANAREMRNFGGAETLIEQYQKNLQKLIQENRSALLQDLGVEGSANGDILREAQQLLDAAVIAANKSVEQVAENLGEAAERFRGVRSRLEEAHAEQAEEFARLEEQNQTAGQTIRERAALEQAVAKLDDLELKRREAEGEVRKYRAERKDLKEAYRRERRRVTELRREVAAELQKEVGESIRIQVLPDKDDAGYRQMLADGLRGARVHNQDEIVQRLSRIDPGQLAQLIQVNAVDELEQKVALGGNRTQKILDAFRANINPFALEAVQTDDKIVIELNVTATGEPNFKDAAELSRGQKCTAILPLLLARRDTPLVIDQPEDNLDNHFIYETVVESIRRLKPHRQMIFITHNANIPVLAEADLVVALDSDGRTGRVTKRGTLDDCREEVIDLLEGGKTAFDMRRQRYRRP